MPQHIKRLLLTLSIVVVLFLVLRFFLVPKSFGEYGHYRGLALEENANRPMHYGGSAICIKCHSDIVSDKKSGHHAGLACEGCHGPALNHAKFADSTRKTKLPDSLKLERHKDRAFCAVCHELNTSRLRFVSDTVTSSVIKMMREKKHGQFFDKETKKLLNCVECHNPHDP